MFVEVEDFRYDEVASVAGLHEFQQTFEAAGIEEDGVVVFDVDVIGTERDRVDALFGLVIPSDADRGAVGFEVPSAGPPVAVFLPNFCLCHRVFK